MKLVLVILIVISWLCGVYVSHFDSFPNRLPSFDYLFIVIIGVNILCGMYLYSRAAEKKIEWALFGLLGNISVVLIFWLWNYFRNSWKKGKSVLGR